MILMPVEDWTTFKEIVVTTKKLFLQYSETSSRYDIYAEEDGSFVWNICLLKDDGADVTDFEDNYKADANGANPKSSFGLKEGGVYGALTLTNANTAYEAKVGADRLAARKLLTIAPLADMFWGYDSSVTASTGTPLAKGSPIVFVIDTSSSFQIWLVSTTAGVTARITESP